MTQLNSNNRAPTGDDVYRGPEIVFKTEYLEPRSPFCGARSMRWCQASAKDLLMGSGSAKWIVCWSYAKRNNRNAGQTFVSSSPTNVAASAVTWLRMVSIKEAAQSRFMRIYGQPSSGNWVDRGKVSSEMHEQCRFLRSSKNIRFAETEICFIF